jgi:flagellar biosynthesis/type III secretory pathway M-ring protein FliF/YscJ
MDFLNKLLAGLGELAGSMSAGARTAAAGSLALVVLSAAWMFVQRADGPDTCLMGGETFSATQLRDMQTAFGKAGLEGYEIVDSRVRVPHGQQSKYMAALADEGALPGDFGEYLRKAVNSSGFLVYGAQQEAQTKVAIQSELQLVISRMKGIERAFVHIAEETSRGFPQTKTVTASVGVEPRDNQTIDDATVAAIRSFVASAWGGLKPEAVTVVDLGGNRLFAGSGGEAEGHSAAGDYARQKKQLELDWQDKITRALAIPGALVTANAKLDRADPASSDVTVSVAVPQSYYEEIWRKRLPAQAAPARQHPVAAELAAIQQSEERKIEAAVLPLLGPAGGKENRPARVAVSTIYSPTATATTEPTAPTARDRATAWLAQNWHALGMGGLILVGLLVLRSTIKSAPSHPAGGGGPTMDSPGTSLPCLERASQPAFAASAHIAARPPLVPTETLREELAGAVRHDPRAAAGVLRSWMGRAS